MGHRSVSSGTADGTTTLTVSTPAGASVGDVLVAVVLIDHDGAAADITAPSGWSQVGGDGAVAGCGFGKVFIRAVSSGEPASHTFGVSASSSCVAHVECLTGADTSTPVDVVAWGGSSSASTSHVAPELSPARPETMMLCAWAGVAGGSTYTPPAAMTELADTNTLYLFAAIARQSLIASGATGTRTATASASTASLTVSLAVNPAGTSAGTESLVWIDPNGAMIPLDVEWAVSGRFAPPPVLVDEGVPEQPGARFREARHGVREFSLPLWITDSSPAALRARLRSMIAAMDPVRGQGTIRLTSPTGDQREIYCRVSAGLELDETLGRTSGPLVQRAVPMFRAVDPYWYDIADTTDPFESGDTATFFPFFPLRLSSSSVFAEATITNSGDVETWPVWTITGPGSAITLRNLTTGEYMTLTITLAAGESLTIDTRPGAKTVTKSDGTNQFPALSSASSLWALARGANALRVEMSGTTAASRVVLSRRHRYLTA
ncbi:phage tail family protein [Allokutzneria sp. A3M-2-11 16]|uniref:phage distal tail protein n=1 Tax=Allokutzneria sp. A3M-2-11 16 TaxID=2962043 RepID=UPI0020B89F4A|nr:phage tail domain-containing protein [Allokutzneria sp. A3M-2-11 16]MCP3805370.1 phage tail family protein [Allokutzneria sp. A3M-2-11 16]